MLTLRLHRPGSRAHIALWGGDGTGWHTRCTQLWIGSEWIDGEQPRDTLVTRGGNYPHDIAGRPLHLESLAEVPIDVPLCTRCIARVRYDHDQLAAAMAARNLGAPPCPPS